MDLLPSDWRSRIDIEKAGLHNIAARVLAHQISPTLSIVEKDQNGKPYFETSKKCLSLSHSYDFAAVLISEKKKCGIDIEKISARVEKIKTKFMRQDEAEFENLGLIGLYLVWCGKEALYKYYALKKLDFRQHLRVSMVEKNGNEGLLMGEISKGAFYEKVLMKFNIIEDYIMVYTQ